jgi:hypothetical protein
VNRLRHLAEQSAGNARFVPLEELWGVATLFSDTFPLDRSPHYPRSLRVVGHWLRLVFLQRAVTNPDSSAVFTVKRPRGATYIVVAAGGALIGPVLPAWVRRTLVVAGIAFALHRQRLWRVLVIDRNLHRAASGAVLISDFVTRTPGSAGTWVRDTLHALDRNAYVTFAAIVPSTGNERRTKARERLYISQFGCVVAARTRVGDQDIAILLRHVGSPAVSGPNPDRRTTAPA